jgi:hypothetical protein
VSASLSWLFHTRRTGKGSGESTHTSLRLAKEEIGQERRWDSSAAHGGAWAGLTQRSAWPLFVDFAALAQHQDELFGGLIPLHEKTALVTFVGMGITGALRYEDGAAALRELRRMAPAQHEALIEVFTQRHREESKGSDFLYLHFAGDRLTFGLQICVLTVAVSWPAGSCADSPPLTEGSNRLWLDAEKQVPLRGCGIPAVKVPLAGESCHRSPVALPSRGHIRASSSPGRAWGVLHSARSMCPVWVIPVW